jgi:putative transposase
MTKKRIKQNERDHNSFQYSPDEARVAMIQMLIPLGLNAIKDALEQEVKALVGSRYERNESPLGRWGSNPGSAFLGDQKVEIQVPRVRNTQTNKEVSLKSHEAIQNASVINDSILTRVINGISCRKYEKAAQNIPETFGIKRSSISKKFVQASSKKLKEFLERDLSQENIVAIFIDGKTFSENEIVVAMGITLEGEKKILGFIETSTENTRVIKEFLGRLIEQGLSTENEILFILDGAKGLSKGIRSLFGAKAFIQRCQWHKRENIISYLSKTHQKRMRKKLQDAYNKPTYQ